MAGLSRAPVRTAHRRRGPDARLRHCELQSRDARSDEVNRRLREWLDGLLDSFLGEIKEEMEEEPLEAEIEFHGTLKVTFLKPPSGAGKS